MIGTLDPVLLEQEARRMVTALNRLRPLTRRRGEPRPDQVDRVIPGDTDLSDVSVSEFRHHCSWE